jgi:hypothetical protein
MTSVPTAARVAFHKHDSKKWWIRDLKNHPMDPGWERGEYGFCHSKMRRRLQKDNALLDVVWDGKRSVIRSAFIVTGKKRNKLRFRQYYFVKKRPIVYAKYSFPTNQGIPIEGKDLEHLWTRISNQYQLCKARTKPGSVEIDDWNRMKIASRNCRRAKHRC